MKWILFDINYAEISMMTTTSRGVHSSLVFTGVNYLIIKQDQIPFVHIKVRILLQSRRNSPDEFSVTKRLAFLYSQTAIGNNTKRSSLGKGKLRLKLVVIESELSPFFRTRSFRQSCMEVKGCSKQNR